MGVQRQWLFPLFPIKCRNSGRGSKGLHYSLLPVYFYCNQTSVLSFDTHTDSHTDSHIHTFTYSHLSNASSRCEQLIGTEEEEGPLGEEARCSREMPDAEGADDEAVSVFLCLE